MLVVYFEFQAQTLHSKELQRQSKKKEFCLQKAYSFIRRYECTDYNAQQKPSSSIGHHDICSFRAVKYFKESFVWARIVLLKDSGFYFVAL